MACRSRHSSGTWTYASTAVFHMPVSEWGLSAQWHGSVAWNTCGRRFHFPECCTGFIHERSLLQGRAPALAAEVVMSNASEVKAADKGGASHGTAKADALL